MISSLMFAWYDYLNDLLMRVSSLALLHAYVMRSNKLRLMLGTTKFCFAVYMSKHSESFALLKTSSKSDLRFQRYRHFCVAENDKLQKEFHTTCIIRCISNIPDIRLIPLDHLTYALKRWNWLMGRIFDTPWRLLYVCSVHSVVKAILQDFNMSAPSMYIFHNNFSIVYINQ